MTSVAVRPRAPAAVTAGTRSSATSGLTIAVISFIGVRLLSDTPTTRLSYAAGPGQGRRSAGGSQGSRKLPGRSCRCGSRSRCGYRYASTTQTCPREKVIRRPAVVLNVVPPLAFGRDQWVVQAFPSRRTRAVPDPVLSAYGGGLPYSRNREVRTVVCWITTVAGDSRPPPVVTAGAPSIDTSQRPLAGDQVKRNDAAG